MFMMREDGIKIGRFKVRKLMSEMKLISKQPGSHAYKKATVERPDIPNVLDRAFTVSAPNEVWCGDITYVLGSRSLALFGCRHRSIRPPRGGLGIFSEARCRPGDQGIGHGL